MVQELKKTYTIEGVITGTYEKETIDIDISLTDLELERIKGLIKGSDCKDFREVIIDEYPELYKQIDDTLRDAAYDFYCQEYANYYAEDDLEEPDVELTGEEYSCPIPKEWPMKYKFQVKVALSYEDKEIEVVVKLSDEEVAKIKQYISESTDSAVEKDGEGYAQEPSLLLILEEKDKKLFDKFWWDTIYPRVFIMMLINGIENGYIEKYEEDDFNYENPDDFDDICDMYSDDIELEHSSCCICRIPGDWLPE